MAIIARRYHLKLQTEGRMMVVHMHPDSSLLYAELRGESVVMWTTCPDAADLKPNRGRRIAVVTPGAVIPVDTPHYLFSGKAGSKIAHVFDGGWID